MKYIPYELIEAAQDYDSEAIEYILKHFEGFIAEESKERYESEGGRTLFYLDDDLRYLGHMPKSSFEKLNEESFQKGEKLFANPDRKSTRLNSSHAT